MSTLNSQAVSGLLDRLFAAADQNDPAGFQRARDAMARLAKPPSDRERAELMRDVYMPITPDVGRLLYVLARSRSAETIVEFGTSYGISGIHLAAALRDAGGRGRLITTEFDAIKAERARENFRSAGLADLIDIRVGDAFETLRGELDGIDLLLLDGWKPLYLPMLKFLEPQLSPGALIIADDLAIQPDALASYVGYVREGGNGYVSVEVPLGDRLEVSVRSA